MIGAMVVALGIDAVIGWPKPLYREIGHPVTWLGRLIASLEQRLNHGAPEARRRGGLLTVIAVIAVAMIPAVFFAAALDDGVAAAIVAGIIAWPLLAARSLHEHVEAVALPLAGGDMEEARAEVSMIVGRNPDLLDEAGIARASVESLAENASDGVIAPLFWGAVFGLPGIFAYKAINTMDSMIGHRNSRYEHFGRYAAKLDDWANWIPARLTGALFCLTAPSPRMAFAIMRRDARKHRSPNAGWPEAAMAAAIQRRLSGPRAYEGGVSEEPWLNAEAPDPTPAAVMRALALYRRAMLIAGASLLALWIL